MGCLPAPSPPLLSESDLSGDSTLLIATKNRKVDAKEEDKPREDGASGVKRKTPTEEPEEAEAVVEGPCAQSILTLDSSEHIITLPSHTAGDVAPPPCPIGVIALPPSPS